MKKTLALILALVMALSMVACGGAAAPAATEAPAADAPAAEAPAAEKPFAGETITICTTISGPIEAAMENIAEFEELTGIKVQFELYEFQECIDKQNINAAGGGNSIDVLCYRPIQETATWYANGYFEPLNDYIAAAGDEYDYEDFGESARAVTTVGDDIVGIPYLVEGEMIWYNEEIFEQYGVEKLPETFDELMAVAEQCYDPANNVYGVALRGAGNNAVTQFSGFLYGFGGDFFDKETMTATMTTPEALAALEYYADLMKFAPDGMEALTNTEAITYFNQGLTAMRVDAYAQTFNHTNPDTSDVVDVLGYMPFPEGPIGKATPYNIVAWAYGISATSEHKDAAWEFLKWVSGKDMEVQAMLHEGWSARISVWSNDEVIASMDPELAATVGKVVADGYPYDRPSNANAGEVRALVGQMLDIAYTGLRGEELKAAIEPINDQIQALLDTEK